MVMNDKNILRGSVRAHLYNLIYLQYFISLNKFKQLLNILEEYFKIYPIDSQVRIQEFKIFWSNRLNININDQKGKKRAIKTNK
ncbi:hypothetical protein [Vulcanisaeta sp. JCM 16159]|uniref:hypothetical protein n=1 Tax=Vulcanisaeta sp. JCM 16159 TaxID=1295371 RepID=UPI0006D042D1|nr:hypothetical protein [Vulcanisaeta sp. JCM 16159]